MSYSYWKACEKLSMNSSAGKRLIFGIANPGETLGLASALSGSRYDFTAETVSPCIIMSLERQDFVEFLMRYPSVFQNAARELGLDFARACDHVRRLGLEVTATAKLARLLLEWCATGQKTERGTRLVCTLTHGEIGECIGSSRETVTRIFTDLKCRELLESRSIDVDHIQSQSLGNLCGRSVRLRASNFIRMRELKESRIRMFG